MTVSSVESIHTQEISLVVGIGIPGLIVRIPLTTMTKEEFENFLEQKARTEKAKPIDWESQKGEWLQNLRSFYSTIGGYLAPYRESGKLKVESSSVRLTEEHIGTYEAECRTVLVGSDKVTLVPVGTFLIGARGRVDMNGPLGTVKFILTGKHSSGISISWKIRGEEKQPPRKEPVKKEAVPEEFVWKIATPPPKVRFIELTPETFFSALTDVVNG